MSLGALVIALGMMVDNAIVVADGIAVRLERGVERKRAAVESASSTSAPLLGATIVAVMAFYPVYASTFIFAAIIAFYAYAEPIKPVNIAGMLVLVLGMFLMGR